MQKNYDLTQLKVKRRGLLADLPPNDNRLNNNEPNNLATQVSCVLLLDKEVVDFFQQAAAQPNALPYQVQINQMLREIIHRKIS
jgi:hypothetical protein